MEKCHLHFERCRPKSKVGAKNQIPFKYKLHGTYHIAKNEGETCKATSSLAIHKKEYFTTWKDNTRHKYAISRERFGTSKLR